MSSQNKIKAILLDVDGTLLSFKTHQMPQSTIDSIRQAHAAGIKVIIATGRAFSDLKELEAIPYDAVAALNGSECLLRDGTIVSQKLIPEEDFKKALALSKQYDFVVALEKNEGILVNRITQEIIDFMRLVAHPNPPVVDIEKEFAKGGCCQMCFYFDDATEKIVMEQLPNLVAMRWHPIFADINVAGVNKAVAVESFAKYYGFDISETMAFGDGGNDIPMLKAAGIGVAMGNAFDSAKAAADYVTDTVDDDGIRNALLHFGII